MKIDNYVPDAPWVGLCREDYERLYYGTGVEDYDPDEDDDKGKNDDDEEDDI